jgi:flagellar protein FlaG
MMTNAIQVTPVSTVAARPVPKRVSTSAATVATAASAAEAKPAHTHVETAQPVEPVVNVQPGTRLTITKDEAANTFVYRSINRDTGEVMWQYPVEQVLRMAHRLRELEGLDAHQIDTEI